MKRLVRPLRAWGTHNSMRTLNTRRNLKMANLFKWLRLQCGGILKHPLTVCTSVLNFSNLFCPVSIFSALVHLWLGNSPLHVFHFCSPHCLSFRRRTLCVLCSSCLHSDFRSPDLGSVDDHSGLFSLDVDSASSFKRFVYPCCSALLVFTLTCLTICKLCIFVFNNELNCIGKCDTLMWDLLNASLYWFKSSVFTMQIRLQISHLSWI